MTEVQFEPLYLRIKERIRADILNDQTDSEGGRLATLNELQVRYEVSRPTISKALAALAAEGVLVKEAGRGMFALSPAMRNGTGLEAPRTTIGFLAPLFGEELPQRAFRGIDRAARRRNCRVTMAGAGDDLEQELRAAKEMISAGASGLIIYPTLRHGLQQEKDYLRSEDLGVPIVLVDTCTPQQGHSQVIFDNRRAGYQMTKWHIDHGHKSIAVVVYAKDAHHPGLELRLKGYRDALQDNDIAFDPSNVVRVEVTMPDESPAEPVACLLEKPNAPTAIICGDDMLAIAVIDALGKRGLKVPEDVAVAGFDNRAPAKHFQPGFPTTNPDFDHLGEVACEILLAAISDEKPETQVFVLPLPILIRSQGGRHK